MNTEIQTRDPQPFEQELSAEFWKAKAESLQEIVCLLLQQIQAMRFQQRASEFTHSLVRPLDRYSETYFVESPQSYEKLKNGAESCCSGHS